MKKRIVKIADLHCGHEFGLTPPEWWLMDTNIRRHKPEKAIKFKRELWEFYSETVKRLSPIDVLIVDGDSIDGNMSPAGEMLTSDRNQQVRMAERCIKQAKAETILITYGTRRHTGKEEDWEETLASLLNCAEPEGHLFFTVNGCTFDVKHKIGSSSIPHGRHTAAARARLWNTQWYLDDQRQPLANIILRDHVHYFAYCGGKTWVVIVGPTMSYGTSFGIRECEGLVDVGIISIDVETDGRFSWDVTLADFPLLKARVKNLYPLPKKICRK